jgi:hypothetical protein
MPEPREAAAITQGCEVDRHGAGPRVDRIKPASQAWRMAGIIGLSGSFFSDVHNRAPIPRRVASTTRSRSQRAPAASFARSLLSPTGSIASGTSIRQSSMVANVDPLLSEYAGAKITFHHRSVGGGQAALSCTSALWIEVDLYVVLHGRVLLVLRATRHAVASNGQLTLGRFEP